MHGNQSTFTREGRAAGQTAIILMYHRIAQENCDPWGLCVAPTRFDEHLEVVRQTAHALTVSELVEALSEDAMPPRSVCITFDDGYADNVEVAKPMLEHHDVSATLYVVSGSVGQRREFWWDELDRLLLQPGKLPRSFEIEVGGSLVRIDLGDDAHLTQECAEQYRHWRAWDEPPTTRHSLYHALWQRLRHMTHDGQLDVLEAVRRWAGIETAARPSRLALSESQLEDLATDGTIEIGCHTKTHPQLSSLPPFLQAEEIRGCKERLEQMVGRSVNTFAYPYGARADYSQATVSIVREVGLSSACVTTSGAVTRKSDRFRLPRMPVQDWTGDEFAKRLAKWFDV